MANEGIIRTNKFDQLVLDATQGETLGENFEAMRAALHFAMANAPAIESASSLPASPTFKFEREIRFAESTGKRTLIIRANTEADLDALEAQILGY